MKIKVTNLMLLGGAFVVAGLASATGISQYDGGDLAGLLTLASLALFVTCASLLWSFGMFQRQRADWEPVCALLNGEFSVVDGGVHGQAKDAPVFARVESAAANPEYLAESSAIYSDSKYFFALTITLPYSHNASWRVLYQPKSPTQAHGDWHVACPDSREVAQALENAGVADLFAEWDPFTVLKCDARAGELTLRYPVPQRFFCPSATEFENELNLLRRVGEIWQHAARSKVAA